LGTIGVRSNSKRWSKGAGFGQRHLAKIYGLYSFGTFFTKFRLLAKWFCPWYKYERTDKSGVTQGSIWMYHNKQRWGVALHWGLAPCGFGRAIVDRDSALQRRSSCAIALNEDFLRGTFKLFFLSKNLSIASSLWSAKSFFKHKILYCRFVLDH